MDQLLKTKLHPDNVKGKDKDITGDDNNNNIARELLVKHGQRPIIKLKDFAIFVIPDITIKTNTMNQMNIKKMLNRKNLLIKGGEIKLIRWD